MRLLTQRRASLQVFPGTCQIIRILKNVRQGLETRQRLETGTDHYDHYKSHITIETQWSALQEEK